MANKQSVLIYLCMIAASILSCFFIVLGEIGLWFSASVVFLSVVIYFVAFPRRFLLFLVAYTPVEMFVVKWLPIGFQSYVRFAPEVLIFFVFILYFLKMVLQKRTKFPSVPINRPLLVFIFVVLLSMFINEVPIFITAASLKNLFRYIAVFYLVLLIDFKDEYFFLVVKIFLWSSLFQASLGILENLIGPIFGTFLRSSLTGFTITTGIENILAGFANAKPSGTIGIYSSYGAFLCISFIIILSRFLTNRKRSDEIFLVVLMMGIFVSRSRTSWLMMLLGAFLIILQHRKHVFGKISLVFICAAIIFLNPLGLSISGIYGAARFRMVDWRSLVVSTSERGIIARPESLLLRIEEIFSIDYWNRSSRIKTYTVVLPELLINYPLLGLGPGTMGSEISGGGSTSRGYFPSYSREHLLDVPHNIAMWTADSGWMSLMSQFGLVGLLSFWMVFFKLYRFQKLSGRIQWFHQAMGAIICCIFASVFSVNYLTYRSVSLFFWLFCGLSFRAPFNEEHQAIAEASMRDTQLGGSSFNGNIADNVGCTLPQS